MDGSIRSALRGSEASDPHLLARALGWLLLTGGSLTLLWIASGAGPEGSKTAALYAIGGVALACGAALILWAPRSRWWAIHAVFAAGTGLICAGVYLAGAATGTYAVLFVWLVVMAASFFTARAVAAHVAWIVVASGVALALVGSDGMPWLTRWIAGSALVVIAAAVVGQLVAGRRETERRLREEVAERARLQAELQHLAHHDPLTGLANRRRLEQELPREIARSRRSGTPLCVIALDLDGLKRYNDAHGHAGGDRLLKQAVSAWAGELRGSDLLARMGGDEFLALLPDCSEAEAERVAKRLQPGIGPSPGCSVGIASWDGHESADELLIRADRAMYAAKAERAGARPQAEVEGV